MPETINIRPDVGVLAVLRYLNYECWYALAEYIDNSIDSFLKNQDELRGYDGRDYKLRVSITIDAANNTIRIADNAAGISADDLDRAMRMAEPPADATSLSEFGMGMKAASCWFAPVWMVETKALGELVTRTVKFDVPKIVNTKTRDLAVNVAKADRRDHYTVITLSQVYNVPYGSSTLSKIRRHLASIYREFIRQERVVITINNEKLSYEAPAVLKAPLYNDTANKPKPIIWHKEFSFMLPGGRSVRGFAAIREKGSTNNQGFALFRRGRVIEGVKEEGYKPKEIFGTPGSARSQRIFGELHLEGFGVSHTKDGFKWDNLQDEFNKKLRAAINPKDFPLLTQTENYYVTKVPKPSPAPLPSPTPLPTPTPPRVGPNSGSGPSPTGGSSGIGGVLPNVASKLVGGLFTAAPESPQLLRAKFNGVTWHVYVTLSDKPAATKWIEIGDHFLPAAVEVKAGSRNVGVQVSLTHPFTKQIGALSAYQPTPIVRLAGAVALAKATAAQGGATQTGLVIEHLNDLLSDGALISQPTN